jgi:phenol 2-monooxygenase
MSRTSREVHYPPSVDTLDPYVLLVHQGMIEDVFLEDLKSRGVQVIRSSPFVQCNGRDSSNVIESTCQDLITGERKTIRSNYVIGCDGAHSQVRKSMPEVTMEGQSGNAAWGVLDGELPVFSSFLRLTH